MKELTVEAIPESLVEILAFADRELTALNCPAETMMQLHVAIDEVFGNIAHYAYEGKEGSATLRFSYEPDPAAVVLTFVDSGIPFDPLQMKAPDTSLKARQRKIGGLGIFMVKNLMDEVQYEYSDGQNVLRMKKLI